jgi:hypothetical protein
MEWLFGPTATNAVIGNGGLSVGISKFGELVVLKWPSPSYYDHLNYRTHTPFFSTLEKQDRYFNAGERWGSFAGIRYQDSTGEHVSWLRSDDWIHKQGYLADDAAVVITTFRSPMLGLTIVGTDLVKPNTDVLARNYTLNVDRPSDIRNVSLIYMANLAPCNTNPDFNPYTDWKDDSINGYGTIFHKKKGVFVSFRPNDTARKNKQLPKLDANSEQLDQFIESVDEAYPALETDSKQYGLLSTKDVYIAFGADVRPTSHYLIPDPGKPSALPHPLLPDDRLISLGPSLVGAEYELDISKKTSSVTIYLVVADRGKAALKLLQTESLLPFKEHVAATLASWTARMERAILPTTTDVKVRRVALRSLVNLLLTIDRNSGMIAGSIANQPNYGLDWTRDGALYNYVLNLSGFHAEAQKHGLFHANIQRLTDGDQCTSVWNRGICHAGSWAQCYYADGRPAWVYDFEIDQVGYGLWSMWLNAAFIPEPQRSSYLRKVYPAIQRAADLLTRLRDPINKLQVRAQEDDLPWTQQSQYGAATTELGLKSAISAGKALGADPIQIARWQARLTELRIALDSNFLVTKEARWDIGLFGANGGILMWPTQHMSRTDPLVRSHSEAILKSIDPFFLKADAAIGQEWWYVAKGLVGVLAYSADDDVLRPALRRNVEILLKDVPTQDTLIYGETLLVRDSASNGRYFDMRVGQPHNTSAGYSYIAARLFYGPRVVQTIPFGNENLTLTNGKSQHD